MKMLRDFVYVHHVLLIDILKCFKIDVPQDRGSIALLRFEVITPDSFMWRIAVKDKIYYLYTEDYVPGIAHVKAVFASYMKSDKWQLIGARQTADFSSSSPVEAAIVYREPDDPNGMMNYAVQSGPDFIFMARSEEDASNGSFSEHTPRGYSLE